MPDEPSGYELSRALQDLRGEVRSGNAQLNQRLDRLVSAEVHTSDLRRVDERMADLAADIVSERESRRAADVKHEQNLQRMQQTQRYVVASIVIPILLTLATIVVALRGGI